MLISKTDAGRIENWTEPAERLTLPDFHFAFAVVISMVFAAVIVMLVGLSFFAMGDRMERTAFTDVATAQGWSEASQIEVLLRYVESLDRPGAFKQFLRNMQTEEDALGNPVD